MVKTKLIIWDWNGTLIDDNGLCYEIANRMLKERNLPPVPSREDYRRIFRFPVKEYYYDMGYTFETETYEDVADEFVLIYSEEYKYCSLQPDAKKVVRAIHEKGIPEILLSATGQKNLEIQTSFFQMKDEFEEVLGQVNDLASSKAERARDLFRRKGICSEEVLFVGDTDHDAEIAQELGCRCVLLTRGHQLKEHLLECGVPLIDELPELLEYL